MSVFLFAATLCITVFLASGKAPKTLQLTSVVFRHGDRSPLSQFPGDLHGESAWPQGYGQLTQVGMRQEYELGHFLRGWYLDFVSDSYKRSEVRIESTDTERTLMSAQTMVSALFQPSEEEQWHPTIPWQPIPVHSMAWERKAYNKANCGKNNLEDHGDFLQMKQKYKKIFEIVETGIGEKITDMGMFSAVTDTLHCEHLYNLSLPSWALDNLDVMYHTIMPDYHNTTSCSAPSRGIVLSRIIADIKEKIFKRTRIPTKAFIYSAHDSTIVALLCALGVYSPVPVPYSTALMVELHQTDPTHAPHHAPVAPPSDANSSAAGWDFQSNFSSIFARRFVGEAPSHGVRTRGWFVQVWLRNETEQEPYKLTLPGCGEDCPLDEFINLTSASILAIRSLACAHTTISILHLDHLWRIGLVTVGAGGAVMLFVVILSLYCHHSYKQKKDRAESPVRYSQLKTEDIPMTTAAAMEMD